MFSFQTDFVQANSYQLTKLTKDSLSSINDETETGKDEYSTCQENANILYGEEEAKVTEKIMYCKVHGLTTTTTVMTTTKTTTTTTTTPTPTTTTTPPPTT